MKGRQHTTHHNTTIKYKEEATARATIIPQYHNHPLQYNTNEAKRREDRVLPRNASPWPEQEQASVKHWRQVRPHGEIGGDRGI